MEIVERLKGKTFQVKHHAIGGFPKAHDMLVAWRRREGRNKDVEKRDFGKDIDNQDISFFSPCKKGKN